MSDDRTTIGVDRETRDRLNARKQEDDRYFKDKESFDHVIRRLLDRTAETDTDTDDDADADADLAALRNALDTIESRTGRIEQAVEQLAEGRR